MPPWELEQRSTAWRDRALIAEQAEYQAEGARQRLAALPGFGAE